jgi:hypothetical protein
MITPGLVMIHSRNALSEKQVSADKIVSGIVSRFALTPGRQTITYHRRLPLGMLTCNFPQYHFSRGMRAWYHIFRHHLYLAASPSRVDQHEEG